MKSSTDTIISALRVLARDIHTDDGVVNACIEEAAGRLEELQLENKNTLADLAVAIQRRDDAYAEIKSDEQINAAIAEACGWTNVSAKHRSGRCPGADDLYVGHEFLPNYCSDLNAMHEAEKSFALKQFEVYVMELLDFIDEPILATARQRAEAFLRTLGKWEEVQG